MDPRFSVPAPTQQWQSSAYRMDPHCLRGGQQQQHVVFPNAYPPDQTAIGTTAISGYHGLSSGRGYYGVGTLDGQASMPSMGITSHSHILPSGEGGRVAPMQLAYEQVSTEHAFLGYQSLPHAAAGMLPPPLYDGNRAWTSDGRTDMILPHSRTPAELGQEPALAGVPTPYGWTLGRDQQPGRWWSQSYNQDQPPVDDTAPLDGDYFCRFETPKVWKHQRSKSLQRQKSLAVIVDGNTSTAKTVQHGKGPGWCLVCQIECNTANILKGHLAGKKHKKRVEKQALQLVSCIQAAKKADAHSIEKSKQEELLPDQDGVIADVMSIAEYNKKIKRAMDREDIAFNDSKHATVPRDKTDMRSGLPEKCEVCNIFCGTRSILESHFAGKKHAARVMLLKQDSMSKGNNG